MNVRKFGLTVLFMALTYTGVVGIFAGTLLIGRWMGLW